MYDLCTHISSFINTKLNQIKGLLPYGAPTKKA